MTRRQWMTGRQDFGAAWARLVGGTAARARVSFGSHPISVCVKEDAGHRPSKTRGDGVVDGRHKRAVAQIEVKLLGRVVADHKQVHVTVAVAVAW